MDVEFVVSYPREAQLGGKYRLEVNIEITGGDWPYDTEEYPLHVMVNAGPGFLCSPFEERNILTLCREGTTGPAQFILTAVRSVPVNRLVVALVNRAGSTIKVLTYTDIMVLSRSDVEMVA